MSMSNNTKSNASSMLGGNLPKEVDTTPITDLLDRDYAAAEERTRELLDQARKLPMTITADDQVEPFALVVRSLRDHSATIEAYRKSEKEPYLRGGQAVDGWFGKIAERLDKTMKVLHHRVNDYQQEKLARERHVREEAERKAREEARAAEEAAKRARSEARKQELEVLAQLAKQRAELARDEAAKAPADITRQRFGSGAMTTMARDPKVEIVDWDLLPLDRLRPYLRRDDIEKAVRAWAKASSYKDQMPGVVIDRDASKSVIR
jgi:flagellar biosynthesis GTPase FlhF